FAEGLTASKWLKHAPRTPREITRVYLSAARGLAAAHAAGLVHRDFKPDNVIVSADGRVRVMDFGLARAAGTGLDPRVEPSSDPNQTAYTGLTPSGGKLLGETLTHDGTLVGTPAYMAPEQAREGRSDALSDQFSFCVSVWEALYG